MVRAEGPGKPLLLKTTGEFLRHFGVNDISDLPKPKEIEELFKENGVQSQPNPLQEQGAQQEAFQDAGMQKNASVSDASEADASGDLPVQPAPETADPVEYTAAPAPSEAENEATVSATPGTDEVPSDPVGEEYDGGNSTEENPAPAPSEAGADHAAQ